MNTHASARLPARSKPLAACIAALFGLSGPAATAANTWPVTSCNDDSDPGTLRNVIAAASTLSGDIVDLSGLNCVGGKITLYAGDPGIHIAQNSLTISGPGADYLAVDGSQLDPTTVSAFYHTGSGTLKIQYLTLTSGSLNRQGYALGGCIYSKANVTLVNATVTLCKAAGDGARGGGIWAGGDVTLTSSHVTTNIASAPNGASGGGIWATGNVFLNDSTVSGNSAQSPGDVFGGGVKSNGYVYMKHSTVSGNTAHATNTDPYTGNTASGAGINASLHLIAYYSAMTDNKVEATGYAHGGGAYTNGYFQCTHCTISNNSAIALGTATGGGMQANGNLSAQFSTLSGNSAATPTSLLGGARGGGLALYGSINTISASTISGNASTHHSGGIYSKNGSLFTLTNSTVSGNSAYFYGGLAVSSLAATFYNATIAFNSAHYRPGAALFGPMTVTLESTLISNNSYSGGTSDNDLDKVGAGTVLLAVSSANNLVRATSISGLPTGILLKGACPLLGPLRDNGGPTMTHALLSGSPAIDTGNDMHGLSEDQRGVAADTPPYPYPRISGSKADIGAYEVEQNDIVFDTGFESCNPIPI